MPPRFLHVVGLSFSLSAAFGWLTSSCVAPIATCGHVPMDPTPEGPLPIREAELSDAENLVDPAGGTLTIERERVTVRYEQGGKTHQIVYAVVAKLGR